MLALSSRIMDMHFIDMDFKTELEYTRLILELR